MNLDEQVYGVKCMLSKHTFEHPEFVDRAREIALQTLKRHVTKEGATIVGDIMISVETWPIEVDLLPEGWTRQLVMMWRKARRLALSEMLEERVLIAECRGIKVTP